MQDDVWAAGDALDPYLPGRRMEERDQLGGAMPNVFMWVTSRLTNGLPTDAGLRNSRVRSRVQTPGPGPLLGRGQIGAGRDRPIGRPVVAGMTPKELFARPISTSVRLARNISVRSLSAQVRDTEGLS